MIKKTMVLLLIITLMFSIVGCGNDESPEDKDGSAGADQGSISSETDMYRQYAKIYDEAKAEYGLAAQGETAAGSDSSGDSVQGFLKDGIIYAGLLDFDGDGTDELYILRHIWKGSSAEPQYGLHQMIYGLKDDKVEMIRDEEFAGDGGGYFTFKLMKSGNRYYPVYSPDKEFSYKVAVIQKESSEVKTFTPEEDSSDGDLADMRDSVYQQLMDFVGSDGQSVFSLEEYGLVLNTESDNIALIEEFETKLYGRAQRASAEDAEGMDALGSDPKKIDGNEARDQAYGNVLEDIIGKHGVCRIQEYHSESQQSAGLAYAERIDFNADGEEELLLYYLYQTPGTSDTGYYGTYGIMSELWYFDGSKAVKAMSADHQFENNSYEVSTPETGLLTADNGKTYIVTSTEYFVGGAGGSVETLVYEFTGTGVEQIATLGELIEPVYADDYDVAYEYSINDKGNTANGILEIPDEDLYKEYRPKEVLNFTNKYASVKKLIYRDYSKEDFYYKWLMNDAQKLF